MSPRSIASPTDPTQTDINKVACVPLKWRCRLDLNTITSASAVVHKINCKYIESLNTSMANQRFESLIAYINPYANTLFICTTIKTRICDTGYWDRTIRFYFSAVSFWSIWSFLPVSFEFCSFISFRILDNWLLNTFK